MNMCERLWTDSEEEDGLKYLVCVFLILKNEKDGTLNQMTKCKVGRDNLACL